MGVIAILWIIFLILLTITFAYEYVMPRYEKKKLDNFKFSRQDKQMKDESSSLNNIKQNEYNELAKATTAEKRKRLLSETLEKLAKYNDLSLNDRGDHGRQIKDRPDYLNFTESEITQLINQQDQEYNQSLGIDKLIKLKKESVQSEKAKRLQSIIDNLQEEPDKDQSDVISLNIKLPNGTNLKRRYLKSNTIQQILNFIDSKDQVSFNNYTLISNYPKVIYNDPSKTIEQLNILNSTTLYITEN